MLGPVHKIEIGVEVEVILIGTNVFVHVIEFVTAFAIALGNPALGVTITVDVELQPVAGFVPTNVNVPADEAVVVKLVEEPLTPPSQVAVVPTGLVYEPVNVTDGAPQVIVLFGPALTPVGAVVLVGTVIVRVPVVPEHPVIVLVIVTM